MNEKPKKALLDGWKRISEVLTAAAGVPISIDQCKRYACREHDPLPTRALDRSERPRRVAEIEKVTAWCVREFEAAASSGEQGEPDHGAAIPASASVR